VFGDIADHRKGDRTAADAADAADAATNALEMGKYTTAMYALATSSIDRSRAAADVVQKASAALAALYTAALGLVFSVTSNPLPPRGILPLLFLGAAVVLSTLYVAYIGPAKPPRQVTPPDGAPEPAAWQRLLTYSATTTQIVTARYRVLRASVLALGAGLLFIAAPFVNFQHQPTASGATAASWPAQPSTGDPDLNKILYQAQVSEAATLRAAKPSPGFESQDAGWLCAGLLVALLIPIAVNLPRPARRSPAPK
jgi:hypothetical protein